MDADIALIGDEKAALQQRILAVLRLGTHWATNATPEQKTGYLLNCLPITLGLLLRLDWPLGAEFAHSISTSDRVLQLPLDLDPAVLAWGPLSGQRLASLTGSARDPLRSLRRAAADTLAVMMQDATFAREVTQQLVEASFFDVDLFPSMHCAVINRFCPSQSFAEAAANPDQAQALAFSLTRIATAACWIDKEVARLVFRECAVGVFIAYQDPWQLKHEPATERARLARCKAAAAAQARGLPPDWGSRPTRKLLPPGMTPQEVADEVQSLQEVALADTMHSTIAAFAVADIRMELISRNERQHLLALCDHAHINIKLDRLLNCCPLMTKLHGELTKTFQVLQVLWLRRAYKRSQEEAAALTAGPVAKANTLRQKGNTAFVGGQLQVALSAYRAALRDNPTDPLLYSNIAAVQLRLGNITEAHNAALCALGHDATNIKAWVRLGDAFREVGRWQLAQLCYHAAIKQQFDPIVQERFNAAAQNVTHAWIWEEVPAPWEPVAVGKWLGTRAPVRHTGQDLAALLMERLTNRSPHAHLSRYMAVQLKQLYCMAVAMNMAKAGAMNTLPAMNEWQCGWTDSPGVGHCSGAVKYVISIADQAAYSYATPAQTLSPMVIVEGKPSASDLLQALALTCLQAPLPGNRGQPYKPKSLKMPYRMLYMYAEVQDALKAWGITSVVIETLPETQRGSKQCNTDWQGNNYVEQYRPEVIFDLQGCTKKDQNNDQRTNSKPAEGSSSIQQQQQQQQAAGSSSSSSAAADAAALQLNEGLRLNDTGPGGQQQQPLQQKGQAAGGSGSSSQTGRQQGPAAGCSVGSSNGQPAGPAAAAAAAAAAEAAASPPAAAAALSEELEEFRQHGGFRVGSSSRHRVMQQPGQVALMDGWDNVTLLREPLAPGVEPKTLHIKLEGTCRQGRVEGVGAWEPGALEWIGVLDRARQGAVTANDRAWMQQEVRGCERRAAAMEQQQREERRQQQRRRQQQ